MKFKFEQRMNPILTLNLPSMSDYCAVPDNFGSGTSGCTPLQEAFVFLLTGTTWNWILMSDALVPEDYHRGGTLSQLEQSIRSTGFRLSQRPTCLHFSLYYGV